VGRSLAELALPESVRVGAILRRGKVVFPTDDTVLQTDDHVMLLLCDKSAIVEVEAVFQVSITFV
jgi:trk system potassium uptake protein TrkA